MAEYSCLVVEDSPMMRQLLVFALSRIRNLRVTEADDGVDGLRKLAASRFDIIITDINMPIMDGLKLVKRIRSDAVHRDTPVVIFSAREFAQSRAMSKQKGASAFVGKPFEPERLIQVVRKYAGQPAAAPTSKAAG